MIVELTHPFLKRCLSHSKLLKDCEKFSTFCYRMEKQAIQKATGGDGEIDTDIQNAYKGDAFELFVECLVRVFGSNILIGIEPTSYKLVDSNDDYGVDALGTGMNGKDHTVQIKYRQANHILTANGDHLTNFRSLSVMSKSSGGFAIDPNDKFKSASGSRKRLIGTGNMTIIHCGKQIHYDVKKNMLSDVREFNRADIRKLVEFNHIFWNTFRESWTAALKNEKKKGNKNE